MAVINKIKKQIIIFSGAWEAVISFLILIAIAMFSINIVIDIVKIVPSFFTTDDSFFVEQFLGRSLELIIAIEFVKMIANNTPGSTIEVLIFAIARSIIVSHGTPLHELLFGVAAIAVLFGIRKWAHKYDRNIIESQPKLGFLHKIKKANGDSLDKTHVSKGKVVDGHILVSTLNQIIGEHIPARSEDTLGHLLASCLKSKKGDIAIGDQVEIENVRLVVHSLTDGHVDKVQVISEHMG